MAAAIYIIWRQMVIQYIVPIVALFQSRVIDHPGAMVETKYSTGGDVEHEVSTRFDMCGFCNGRFGRSSWPAESSSWSLSLSLARQIQMLWPNCSLSFYVRHPTVCVSSFLIRWPATAETDKSIDSKGMRIWISSRSNSTCTIPLPTNSILMRLYVLMQRGPLHSLIWSTVHLSVFLQ